MTMTIRKGECFYIFEKSTDEAVRKTKSLIERLGLKDEFQYAEIRFEAGTVPWTEDPRQRCNYPLRLFFRDDEIVVSAVSAGYRGAGPCGTLELLELLGASTPEIEDYILGGKGKRVSIWVSRGGTHGRL